MLEVTTASLAEIPQQNFAAPGGVERFALGASAEGGPAAIVWPQGHAEQRRVAGQLVNFLPGDGGDQVGIRLAKSGPVGAAGRTPGAIRLECEPLGVVLAVPGPQVAEGVAAVQVQVPAQPVPAEPVRRFRLGALSLGA